MCGWVASQRAEGWCDGEDKMIKDGGGGGGGSGGAGLIWMV